MSTTSPVAPLSQGTGYGVVIGLGAAFAIGMIGITHFMKKRGTVDNSEEFTGDSFPSMS